MNNGIRIIIDVEGSGKIATRHSAVTIRYSGRLNKGHVFQPTIECNFTLGKREVMAGLEYAVEGMKAGGRRQVKVAPHLAYRDKGIPNSVPPNALLILDIELLSVDA